MKKRFLILMMAGLLLAGCGGSSDNRNVAGNGGLQSGVDSVSGESSAGDAGTENATEQQVYACKCIIYIMFTRYIQF